MFRPALWNRNDNMTTCTNPFELMDRMFGDLWNADFSGNLCSTTGMKTDVLDEGSHYLLEAELPGFQKEDIHVDLKDDVLTVSAAHNEEKEDKDKHGNYVRRERRYASFERSFKVNGLKTEDIDAKYENGILGIRIPKKEALPEKEIRQIEVK